MNKNPRNVVSLTEVRLPELRSEIDELRDRLQNVTEIFADNNRSFGIVADIALTLQQACSVSDLDAAIGEKMVEKSADEARLYIDCSNARDIDATYVRPLGSLDIETQVNVARLDATKCESCRADTYKALLDADVDDPASIAMIPISFETLRGLLVVGARDPDFFSRDVSTDYLDFLGATLARSAYRVFAA